MNQVAVQVAMAVMMALRDVKGRPKTTIMVGSREPQRQRSSGPILVKPAFNWGTQDRYVKLMNSEIGVTNILETKVNELTKKEKVPVI